MAPRFFKGAYSVDVDEVSYKTEKGEERKALGTSNTTVTLLGTFPIISFEILNE